MPNYRLSFALCLSLAVASSCDDVVGSGPDADVSPPLMAATSEWSGNQFAFAVPIFLDCLNEQALWSGVVRFEDHVVTRPDGSAHINERASLLPGSTLQGASGTWINPRISSHTIVNCSARDLCFFVLDDNVIVNERITWEHQQTGAIMDVDTRIRLIRAGNGEWKQEVFQIQTCEYKGA